MKEFKNILLIQLGDIGDVVLTTPTIRAVKEAHPDAHISILVRKPYGNLLEADPNIHEVVESENVSGNWLRLLNKYAAFAWRLRQARYDLVIDLRTGDRGAILSFLTGASIRIGWQGGESKFWKRILFTQIIQDPPYAPLPVHPGAEQSLHVVRAIGMVTKDSVPRLHFTPEDKNHALALLAQCGLKPVSHLVTINPCSRWKYKEWGYKKWGELIDILWQEYQLTSLLVGAPEDVEALENISMDHSSHSFNLAGKTTLGELAALLSTVTLHLGVDSAASHIAAAVGTPTVTIFGPGNWRAWTVVNQLHRIVTADLPCVPCNRKGCNDSGRSECLELLTVETVIKEIEIVLDNMPGFL